jgi:hypothetical protein
MGCTLRGQSPVTDNPNNIPPAKSFIMYGRQKCAVGGATDEAGFYDSNGAVGGYWWSGVPAGWTYSKTLTGPTTGGNSLPSGEFTDPYNPNLNGRFFGGNVFLGLSSSADDTETLEVWSAVSGLNQVLWAGGCYAQLATAQSGPPCTTLQVNTASGSQYVNANPGDSFDFSVTNVYAPNNGTGVGDWGKGSAEIDVPITTCYTAAYITQLNGLGGGYQNVTDYHPTADGVCTPVSSGPSTPALSAQWQENSSASLTKSIAPGTSITIPFSYWNSGQTGSVLTGINCTPKVLSGNASIVTYICGASSLTAN